MDAPIVCPYCNNKIEFKDSSIIYGKSYGMVYICSNYPNCKTYVGVHKNTDISLGTLANEELREYRKLCHYYFDKLWQSGKMKRKQAYKWMQDTFNLTEEKAHIAMFDIELAKRFLEHIKKINII